MKAADCFGMGGFNVRDFIFRAAFVCIVNFILLLISNQLPYIGEGMDVRVAAFVPIVFGIIWGLPAAVGVAIGNAMSDAVCGYDAVSIFFGGLFNGLAALLAYRIFYSMGSQDNLYIHNTRSLVNFLLTIIVTELILSVCVSMLLVRYSGMDMLAAFRIVFFNNVEFSIMFGLPVMLVVPSVRHKTCEPKVERKERWRFAAFLLILVPAAMALLIQSHVISSIESAVAISLVSLVLFVIICPRYKVNAAVDEFHSLKYTGFRQIMGISMIVSILLTMYVSGTIRSIVGMENLPVDLIYFTAAFIIGVITVSFAMVQGIVEKRITEPMYRITSRLRTDDDKGLNEIAVLKDRLDFASEFTEDIGGNEYRLYIGLTTKDGKNELDAADVMPVIDSICLRYVGGYHSVKTMVGGYRGNEAECKENVLMYTIYGATDEQISNLVIDVTRALNQESVMIEKNRVARWYHSDGTSEDV